MPYIKHQLMMGTKSIKCDSCGKEWKYQVLCPVCWNKMLDEMQATGWHCLKCGAELWVETREDDKVTKVICPKCRVVFLPM